MLCSIACPRRREELPRTKKHKTAPTHGAVATEIAAAMSAAATETAQRLWWGLAHARGASPCGRSGTGTAFHALQYWVPVVKSNDC